MKHENEHEFAWFNYKTKEYDYHVGTPNDMATYLPQSEAAQNMYSLLVMDMGYSKEEAAIKVLTAIVGDAK